MYTPAHNRETDQTKIVAFMRAYPFATLVTANEGALRATHLPVLVHEKNDALVLLAHVARANPHWRDFGAAEAMVIFQEPHVFVSTRHYERPLSVPTWNYIAVHAYGTPTILASLDERIETVKETVALFEGNLDQWNTLPQDFINAKANGVVAFEMPVTRLEARFKLSQDRTLLEQERIITTLQASPDTTASTIATLMRERAISA